MTGSTVINRIVIVLGNKRHKRNKGNSWQGCAAARFSKSWQYFGPKKMSFPTSFFSSGGGNKTQHYVFANRNYVIIDKTKTATNRFLKSHFESTYYTFFFFGIEKTNTLIHSRT